MDLTGIPAPGGRVIIILIQCESHVTFRILGLGGGNYSDAYCASRDLLDPREGGILLRCPEVGLSGPSGPWGWGDIIKVTCSGSSRNPQDTGGRWDNILFPSGGTLGTLGTLGTRGAGILLR